MKKMIAMVALAVVAVAGVAVAGARSTRPSDDEVNAAIDARLHQMLVKLNAQKK